LILPFAAWGDGAVIPPTALPDPVEIPFKMSLRRCGYVDLLELEQAT